MASVGLPPPRIATSPPSPPADALPLRSPSFPILSHTTSSPGSSPACERPAPARVYRSMIDVAKAAPKKKGNKEAPAKPPAARHDAIQNMMDCEASSAPDGAKLTRPATSPDLLKIESHKSPPPRSETDLAGRENKARRSPQPQKDSSQRPSSKMSEKSTPSQKEPSKGESLQHKATLLKRMSSFLGKKKTLSSSPPQDQPLSTSPPRHVLSAFSLASSNTSVSGTPPSPRSRESTFLIVDEEQSPDEACEDGPCGHGHSSSTSDMREQNTTPRPGITWGPDFNEEGSPMEMRPRPRRRSISQDHLTFLRRKEDGSTPVELMATFSFMSAEGVGAKSRRLSTSLPDELRVDFCELDNEFRSSSHVPGRRGATIGKGATATVKLMFKKNDMSHTYYAVKEFRKKERAEDELDYVKKVKSEFSIAASLHHPNIVRTVRLCTHAHRWNHVMEYCQYGELFQWVEKGLFKTYFKLSDRLCLFKQLMRGVDYLHARGIAHRDIKLENILLSADGMLKITDFGVSEVFSGDHPGMQSTQGRAGLNMGPTRKCAPGICGSLPYIAPEVLTKNSDYDPRPLDVWSCAIVYLTMTLQGSPWSAARMADLAYKRYASSWAAWLTKHPDGRIHDGPGGAPAPGPIFSPECLGSPAVKRLVLKMMDPDPARRITMRDALNSSYVRGIECCAPERADDEGSDDEAASSQDGCGEGSTDGHSGATVTGLDSRADCCGKGFAKTVLRKHNHVPPAPHRMPGFLVHRFDMGDGYR